jgi:beta-glucosidase-like glycosyl hydrolase
MSDAKKLLEAAKAEHLLKAQEIDRDLKELERLTAKYGFEVSKTSSRAAPKRSASAPIDPGKESVAARARRESEEIIKARGEPVPLTPLFEEVTRRGVKLGGQTPKSTLSAYLGQGKTLESTPQGWWFKGQPIPKKPRKSLFAGGGNETPDSELSGASKSNGALPLIAN